MPDSIAPRRANDMQAQRRGSKLAAVSLRLVLNSADFALRLAFFAAAPFVLVWLAELFPITGALVQIALALVVFFAAETVRRTSVRAPLLGRVLASKLEFEAYYREHPPRPFLYYVFCPLLLPHWLWRASSRRELFLYKGYTWPAIAFLLASLAVQYVRAFPPQLTFRDFWPLALATLGVETCAVLMFMMPLVTSMVKLHQERAPRRMTLLLLAGLVSIGFAVARVEKHRDPIVSYATRTRVRLRTQADHEGALRAAEAALTAGWQALEGDRQDIDADGKVEGAPLEVGRQALMAFYKNDEAHAFDLWLTRAGGRRTLVVFFPTHRGHQPIWRARNERGEFSEDPELLAPRLQRAMGVALRD